VTYVVSTPTFSGPLELLLSLVTSHELDILDIELAPVVDAFVREVVHAKGELPLEQLSEFLLVAAILLELKSRRLLPGPDEVDDDEELVGWEERDVLLARLLELRAYAAAADLFAGLLEAAGSSTPRSVGLESDFVVTPPDLLVDVTGSMVAEAYLRAVEERPEELVDLSHVTVDAVTVAETVATLARGLPRRGTVTFRALVADLQVRLEIIVHFLAILELCKLGRVALGQGSTFGDLQISWIGDEPDPEDIISGTLEVDSYDG